MRPSPYETVMGEAWSRAPDAVRAMHRGDDAVAEGRAIIVRGSGLLARLAAAIFGFPSETMDTQLQMRFEQSSEGEVWTRRFGADFMKSRQWAGRGADLGLLCEGMGPPMFASALALDGARLTLTLRGWRIFGFGLPLCLAPQIDAVEATTDDRFTFDVAIGHPLTGPIVRYRGWLDGPTVQPPTR